MVVVGKLSSALGLMVLTRESLKPRKWNLVRRYIINVPTLLKNRQQLQTNLVFIEGYKAND